MVQFRFLAGLPRSGSTVLATLLSQHPDLHTSATSILRDLIHGVRRYHLGESPYFTPGEEQLLNTQRGLLHGFYDHVKEPYVLEKDRGWASDCQLIETLTGKSPRIVTTVRRISEILASFSLLADRVGPTNKIDDELRLVNRPITQWSRSRILWEKYVYTSWRSLKNGYENNLECFYLVEYQDLISNSHDTLQQIYDFLGLNAVVTSTEKLVNPSPETDAVYGIPGLHDVREKLERTSPPPEIVLGEEVCAYWDKLNLEFWRHG